MRREPKSSLVQLIALVDGLYQETIWKEIKKTEKDGRYFVGTNGQVISMIGEEPIVLRPQHWGEYNAVWIDEKPRRIHELVADAFIREKADNEVIHHLDGDKTNNDLSNLVIMMAKDHIKLHAEERRKEKAGKNGAEPVEVVREVATDKNN